MAKNLVIVESPAKAKTLKKFLGANYKVEASVGHVRDLPKSELGVNTENDFEPKYITIRGMGEVLAKLRKEAKTADKVYLATDPDREGEAISWHLTHALRLEDKKAHRITFNEITKNAVKNSLKQARAIDMQLVDAQQARRVLDRVVGYKIGPLLWKKVKKGLSAGRVQSAGLKIIRDREEEIENFIQEEYWTMDAVLSVKGGEFTARLAGTEDDGKISLTNADETAEVVKYLKKQKFIIREVKKGTRTKKAVAPFITSTLQQEASKLLGFATSKTMTLAQRLYEGVDIAGEGTVGLITYIRTDSYRISDEAYNEAGAYVKERFGEKYLATERPEHKSKGRSQDAHEAIRPSYTEKTPDSLKDSLSKDQYKLYKLIWERFVASRMSPAVYDTLSVRITAGKYVFRAAGSVLKFDGYLSVYNRNEETKDEDVMMPEMSEGAATLKELTPERHFTQPPARFNEAMLVRTLEELGIGRPSTYSAIITTLLARGYVVRDGKTLFSTELGAIVNEIMENNFADIIDIDFTAKMESDLDKVEEGEVEWKDILRNFYPAFAEEIKEAEEKIGEIEIEDEKTDILCENCGRNMVIKYGRYGKFLACPGFPECRNAKTLFEEAGVNCPLCGGKVLIKKTKKGRKYYGCDNTDCALISWNVPTGSKCPECCAFLIEKGSKARRIACSDTKCGYSEPIAEESGD